MITTKEDFKTQLNKQDTIADARLLLQQTQFNIVQDFVLALEVAMDYIELTMRDEFLYKLAEDLVSSTLRNRMLTVEDRKKALGQLLRS